MTCLYFICTAPEKGAQTRPFAPLDARVGFEMDGAHALKRGDVPCAYSYFYESVVGTGRVEFIDGARRKKPARWNASWRSRPAKRCPSAPRRRKA